VKLKQEQLAFVKGPELRIRRRLPEVDLVDARLRSQKIEPVLICDADVDPHRGFIQVPG